MMRRLRTLVAHDEAQSLLEFALVVPFLIVLIAACVDFGFYMYDANLIANAARAGVQYGSQNSRAAADIPGMIAAAQGEVGNIVVTVNPTACTCGGGSATTCPSNPNYNCPADYVATFVQVQVQNTQPFSSLVALPGLSNFLIVNKTAVEQVSP